MNPVLTSAALPLASIPASDSPMATQSIQAILDDFRYLNPHNADIIDAVISLVHKTIPDTTEEVKYGGILFTSGVVFSGVFSYRGHVTVEFAHGARITDTAGFLEGSGKFRRHIKLHSLEHIKEKQLSQYLKLALKAAQQQV